MEFFTTNPAQGAYHISEIPQVFGTYLPGSTPEQIELSKSMQKMWANMAKNPQSGPMEGWQRLSKSSQHVQELGDNKGQALVASVQGETLDRNCTQYAGMGQLLGVLW
jgi:carboxylesterase type B